MSLFKHFCLKTRMDIAYSILNRALAHQFT
jgi:hypothetical protein